MNRIASDESTPVAIWRPGLGYVPALAVKQPFSRLIVLEPDEELFALSLEVTDWTEILSSQRCLLILGPECRNRFLSLIRNVAGFFHAPWKWIMGIERSEELLAELEDLTREARQRARESEPRIPMDSRSVDIWMHGPPTTAMFFPAMLESAGSLDFKSTARSSSDARFRFLCSPPEWTHFLEGTKPGFLLGLNRGALPPAAEKAVAESGIPQALYFLEDPDWYDPNPETWSLLDRVYVFDPGHGKRLEAMGYKGRRMLPPAAALRAPSTPTDSPRYAVTFVGSSGFNRGVERYFDQMERVCPGVGRVFQQLKDGLLEFGADWLKKEIPDRVDLSRIGSPGLLLKMIEETATIQRHLWYLNALIGSPLIIFGDSAWADTTRVGALTNHYAGRGTYYPTETAAIYASSEININLFHLQCERSLILRVYDVMACGGFLLSEYTPAFEDSFRVGEELDVFRTPGELKEKVEFYLAHPERRREIARCGQRAVLTGHTYAHRLRRVVGDLGFTRH
ncbi:MAG TPA: glycosyltransferase [bacterium]|nr:glycosyltransferase [bacterium]